MKTPSPAEDEREETAALQACIMGPMRDLTVLAVLVLSLVIARVAGAASPTPASPEAMSPSPAPVVDPASAASPAPASPASGQKACSGPIAFVYGGVKGASTRYRLRVRLGVVTTSRAEAASTSVTVKERTFRSTVADVKPGELTLVHEIESDSTTQDGRPVPSTEKGRRFSMKIGSKGDVLAADPGYQLAVGDPIRFPDGPMTIGGSWTFTGRPTGWPRLPLNWTATLTGTETRAGTTWARLTLRPEPSAVVRVDAHAVWLVDPSSGRVASATLKAEWTEEDSDAVPTKPTGIAARWQLETALELVPEVR
ncbi:MAG: hypothetical protein HY815_34325 [Candidatus Riflebacteria bacterium]|nr:hypothetical protein [Candidatus Riflebacteria bacterium]